MIRGLLSDDKFRFYDNTNYNGSLENFSEEEIKWTIKI